MNILLQYKRISAVFVKDLRSELRTRYASMSLGLFVVVTILMVVFATAGEKISSEIASALLWIILFFSSMTGLGRSFVSEEERGTSLYLHIVSSPSAVFFGKLFLNMLLSVAVMFAVVVLVAFTFDSLTIGSWFAYLLVLFVGSISLSVAATIISAIIAKAQGKGALFPVLSFPLVLPIILIGVESLTMSLSATPFTYIQSNIILMISYSVILGTVSFLLFDFVWKE